MDSIFNTDYLFRVTGYTVGLLVMLLLGLSIQALAGKVPRRVLVGFFVLLLVVFLARQALEVLKILVGRNLIPRYAPLTSLVIFALTHLNWFAFALMGITGAFTAALLLRMGCSPPCGRNPAQARRQKAEHRSQRRHAVCILACLLFCTAAITVIREHAGREAEISPPLELPVLDESIVIPLERINDGNLHRFLYRSPDGIAVRYIVIKKSENAYGVGLDACDICGPSGYYQRKNQVVCKLCDVVMNIATIGFPGGCNPVPLRFRIVRGTMVIRAADLDAEKSRFR
jgi:uncharacterized membrane protein